MLRVQSQPPGNKSHSALSRSNQAVLTLASSGNEQKIAILLATDFLFRPQILPQPHFLQFNRHYFCEPENSR